MTTTNTTNLNRAQGTWTQLELFERLNALTAEVRNLGQAIRTSSDVDDETAAGWVAALDDLNDRLADFDACVTLGIAPGRLEEAVREVRPISHIAYGALETHFKKGKDDTGFDYLADLAEVDAAKAEPTTIGAIARQVTRLDVDVFNREQHIARTSVAIALIARHIGLDLEHALAEYADAVEVVTAFEDNCSGTAALFQDHDQ